MPQSERLTATAALSGAIDEAHDPIGRAIAYVCPYPDCRTFAQHHWGVVQQLTVYPDPRAQGARPVGSTKVVLSRCEACGNEVVFINGKMAEPHESEAPAPHKDLPADLVADFQEARQVLPVSTRGAAALLRLVVQKLLPMIGANEDDINKMIGQLVKEGKVNGAIQQALDSVRVIGNEAVHPGTMDLKDDEATAMTLFSLINYIVEKAIAEPKEIAAIYSGLPAGKLAGIAQRDAPKAS